MDKKNNPVKISFFTTTRAESAYLIPLLDFIQKDNRFDFSLYVGGTHLAHEYGLTIKEIENSGHKVTGKFDYLLNGDTSYSLGASAGIAISQLNHVFEYGDFDYVCVFGDRYEILSIIQLAIIYRKPIIHIGGGEHTLGVIDEQVRHMVTKASHLHFTNCEEYANNILKMGESNWRVENTGSLAIDNIINIKQITKKDLFRDLGLKISVPLVLMTYHPVTLEYEIDSISQINNIFRVLKQFNFQVIVTDPNIELDSLKIKQTIYNWVETNDNYHSFHSLGSQTYHSLIPHCKLVLGNSSSGIIEVPYFKIPTINIGDRQSGRIKHESIIDVNYSTESIKSGIEKILSKTFCEQLSSMNYKFGDGHAAERIINKLATLKIDQNLLRKKLDFSL